MSEQLERTASILGTTPSADIELPRYIVTQTEADLYQAAIQAEHPDDRMHAMAALGKACPAFYIHAFLKIRDEDRNLQPFNRWNDGQWEIYTRIAQAYYNKKPVRLVILKPRQIGSTTFLGALDYWASATRFRSNGILLAHEDQITKRIFRILRRYHENVPDWLRPATVTTSRQEMCFDQKGGGGLDSSIFIDTAGRSKEVASKVGRGDTLHLEHLSEFDHYAHQDELLLSMQQGLPDVPESFAWFESTANGAGGFMDKFWQRSPEQTGFEKIFLSWKHIPWRPTSDGGWARKYSRELPIPAKEYRDTITAEEYELIKDHSLTLNQVEWRRYTIRVKCVGDEDYFRQEYPLTAIEAFIGSGESVFSQSCLRHYEQLADKIEPAFIGRMKETPTQIFASPERKGPVKIYEYPKPGYEYILGYDPSAGYESGDLAAISVFCRDTLTFVAHYYAKDDVPVSAEQAVLLGQYYNEALIVPDCTGIGMAAVWALKRLDYRRLYMRRDIDKRSNGGRKDRWGYVITSTTRPILISDLRNAIENKQVVIYDKDFIFEARRFAVVNGKEQASKNSHDDLLFSAALALRGHAEHGRYMHRLEERVGKQIENGLNARTMMGDMGYARPLHADDILGDQW